MLHARSQHPNAPLTPEGRRRMAECVLVAGWTIEATAQRFQVDAKTVRNARPVRRGRQRRTVGVSGDGREIQASRGSEPRSSPSIVMPAYRCDTATP